MNKKYRYSRLTWKEMEERLNDVVFVVIGTTEQNGPHAPLAFDSIVVENFANEVAKKTNALVFDTLPVSNSAPLRGFPGTVYLRPETLKQVIKDIYTGLVKNGFKKIIAVNHHAPNQPVMEQALREIQDEYNLIVPAIFTAGIANNLNQGLIDTSAYGHGAEPTNSIVYALEPDSIRMDLAVNDAPRKYLGMEVKSSSVAQFEGCPVNIFIDNQDVSKTGCWGDATVADADKGKELFSRMVDWGVKFTEMYKNA